MKKNHYFLPKPMRFKPSMSSKFIVPTINIQLQIQNVRCILYIYSINAIILNFKIENVELTFYI